MSTRGQRSCDTTPLIRCSVMRDNLRSLEKLDAINRDRLLALFDDDERERILSGVGWVPAEYDARFNLGMLKILGTREAFATMRWIIRDQLHSPLLGPIVVPALRIFGISPGSILRLAPRMWPLVYRNCGEFHVVERNRADIVLRWSSVPDDVAKNRAVAALWSCALEAPGAFLDIPTRGRLTSLVDGTATYEIRWQVKNEQFLDDDSQEIEIPKPPAAAP